SQHQKGNVLLIALATTSIMGLTLASYLTLTSSQNVNTSRGQSWNLAIPVAEAGIEEALTQLYYNSITNLTANNWTYSTGQYTKQRSLDGTNYYKVQIQANVNPTITAQGFVRLPMSKNKISRRV